MEGQQLMIYVKIDFKIYYPRCKSIHLTELCYVTNRTLGQFTQAVVLSVLLEDYTTAYTC